MSARRYSPHQILYVRAPYALGVCLFFFTLTLFIAPFLLLCIGIAVAVGLIASVISADELTGGKALSWLHVPLLVGGGYVAQMVSVGDSPRIEWVLIIQYISLAFAVDFGSNNTDSFQDHELSSEQVDQMTSHEIQQALAADSR